MAVSPIGHDGGVTFQSSSFVRKCVQFFINYFDKKSNFSERALVLKQWCQLYSGDSVGVSLNEREIFL